jgi:hypothetical protein
VSEAERNKSDLVTKLNFHVRSTNCLRTRCVETTFTKRHKKKKMLFDLVYTSVSGWNIVITEMNTSRHCVSLCNFGNN